MTVKAKQILTYVLFIVMSLALITGCSPPKADVIKIGGNFELTGSWAEYGKKEENGVKLAIKEVNAKGGVLGKQIEYASEDNKSDAAQSAAVTTKLITQAKVTGIIGPATTGNTLATIPIVTDNKVPLITPSGTNTAVTVGNDGTLNNWLFRTCYIDSFQGEAAADFAEDILQAKTAALVIDQKGDYAKGLAQSFKDTFEKAGNKVVISEKYVAGEETDFSSILTNIKTLNPEVVFVPGYYTEVGMIVKQARALKINVPILGGDGWGTGPVVDIAGKEAMNNTYYIDLVAADDPTFVSFAADYKKEYDQDADSFAALGYDAANMMITAIEKAGNTDTEKVRAALETLSGFKGISGDITVDPATHNPKKKATILKFVDGKKIFVTKVVPK